MSSWAPFQCQQCGESAPSLLAGVCPACVRRNSPPHDLITRDRLLEVLADHVGAARGISIEQLVACMIHPHREVPDHTIGALARSVRELVMQLRMEGHHICAHPRSGYYLAADANELNEACEFLFDRAMTSLQQVAAMKRVSLPDLRGQLHLPT